MICTGRTLLSEFTKTKKMYQFSITPHFCEPVIATIDAEWDEAAPLELSGSPVSVQLVTMHLDSYGMTPHGRAVDSSRLAPMDFHRTFTSNEDYQLESVIGEWLEYPSDRTPPSTQSVVWHQEAIDDVLDMQDWLSQDFWMRDSGKLKAIRDHLNSLRSLATA